MRIIPQSLRGGISLVALMLFFFASPALAQVESVSLVAPTGLSGAPGDTVVVGVDMLDVIGVSELATIKVAMVVDPLVLTPVDVTPSAALASWPAQDFSASVLVDRIEVVAITSPASSVAAGEMLAFRFVVADEAVDAATTVLDITGVDPKQPPILLVDSAAPNAGVKVAQQDGEFTVVGGITCAQGDARPDGSINSADAIVVLRIVTGLLMDPTGLQRCGADADRDGDIDSGDAVWVLRDAVGLDHLRALRPLDATARLVERDGNAQLVVEPAWGIYGMQVDLTVDGDLELGALPTAVTGLRLESQLDAVRRVAWASTEELTAGDHALVLDLPTVDGTGAIALRDVKLFDAQGREVSVLTDETQVLLSGERPADRRDRASLGNFPNPFNPSTTVHFELPRASRVRIDVYNAAGERVRTLLNESRGAGPGDVVWNGTDSAGSPVASGVYYAQLVADGSRAQHRLLLVK